MAMKTGKSRQSPEELRAQAREIEESGESPDNTDKDPSRVAAGKKAAATRKERYGTAQPGAGGQGRRRS